MKQRLQDTRSDAGRPVNGLVDWVRGEIDKGTAVSLPISEASRQLMVNVQQLTGDWKPVTYLEV
jgi:outer membrane biogenesis lipoprotein LolB